MTTNPATTATQPPWKVRWAAYTAAVLAVLILPHQTAAVGRHLLNNLGEIIGVNDTTPIVVPLPDGNQ